MSLIRDHNGPQWTTWRRYLTNTYLLQKYLAAPWPPALTSPCHSGQLLGRGLMRQEE